MAGDVEEEITEVIETEDAAGADEDVTEVQETAPAPQLSFIECVKAHILPLKGVSIAYNSEATSNLPSSSSSSAQAPTRHSLPRIKLS